MNALYAIGAILTINGIAISYVYTLFEDRVFHLLKLLNETHQRINDLEVELAQVKLERQYDLI